MLKKFIKLCLIFILIGGVFILYKQVNIRNNIIAYIQNLPSVKGISTSKGGDVSNQVKSQVDKGINQAEKKVTNTKISDLINIYNQTQKYAKDFRAFQEYIKKEAANLIKKK
jgi:hypothetical protein